MVKTTDDLFAALIFAVIFMPAVWGLLVALFKLAIGKVDWNSNSLWMCIAMHIINTAISPGIPAYLLHLDKQTGGGSVGSLLSFFLIPVTWLIFLKSRNLLVRAESAKRKVLPEEIALAIEKAIKQFSQGQFVNQHCPACRSIIKIELLKDPSIRTKRQVETACICDRCSGTYEMEKLL